MERADEVRQVAETDVEGNLGDGTFVVGQQARGVTQPRTDEVLMRGDAEHQRKEPQEMKRTEAGFDGGIVEADWLVRMRVYPERGFDRAAAVEC